MDKELRQSTADTFVIGPILTTAFAPYTTNIAQANIRLSKNGAAFAAKSDVSGSTHLENGFHQVTLDATDTNTIGDLLVKVYISATEIPFVYKCRVEEAKIYDSLRAASRFLPIMNSDGYDDQFIYYNNNLGSSGQVVDVNGTKRNPVNNETDLYVLGGINTDFRRGFIAPGSTVLSSSDYTNWHFESESIGGVFAGGDRSYTNTSFKNLSVYGGFLNTGGRTYFEGCELAPPLGSMTVDIGTFKECSIYGTVNLDEAGIFAFINCRASNAAGSAPKLAYKSGTVDQDVKLWYTGEIEIAGMEDANDYLFLYGRGKITFDATCTTGKVVLCGEWEVIDNSTSGMDITSKDAHISRLSLMQALKNVDISGTSDIAGSWYQDWDIETDQIQNDIANHETTILAKLPLSGRASTFQISDTVDGETIEYIFELIMSMVNGRYKVNQPSTNKVTFYKRDNTTVLTVVDVQTTERTRDS